MSVFNLPKWLFNLLICVSLFGSYASNGTAADHCVFDGLKKRIAAADHHSVLPPLISKHAEYEIAHKVLDVNRLKKSAQVMNIHNAADKTRLAGLPDGTYLYVIDKAGHTAIVNRTMDPGAAAMRDPHAAFLGSHLGLASLLEREFKAQPQYVATGEFLIRSGQVKLVSNGSGTFRGETANLTYGAEKLKSLGLAIDSKTQLWDYSVNKYPNPHGEGVVTQVRDALEIMHDPHLKKIWDHTRQVMRQVDPNYQDSTGIRAMILNPATPAADKTLLFQGIQFISGWRQLQDEEGYIVRHYLKSMGEEKYLKLLKKLSEVVPANAK